MNKVSLHLQGVPLQHAFELRQKMADHLQHGFPKALDELLGSQFDAADQVYIDKLQLEIHAPAGYTDQQLQQLILTGVATALEKKKTELSYGKVETPKPGIAADIAFRDSFLPFKAWTWYLLHGSLPWWYSPVSHQAWLEEIVIMMADNQDEMGRVFMESFETTAARLRWVLQVPVAVKDRMLQRFFSTHFSLLAARRRQLPEILERLKQANLAAIRMINDEIQDAIAWLWIAEEIFRNSEIHPIELERKLLRLLPSNEVTKQLSAPRLLTGLQTQLLVNDQEELLSGSISIEKEKVELGKESAKQIATDDALIVYNAGIVLLHPFIVPLFTALDVLGASRQINDPCKAITLLARLCGDEQEIPEYTLPLLKLFCGITDEAFVFVPAPLNQEELDECHNLLMAVTSHWTVLKGTSAAGLQETFLKRMGKLRFKTDHYELQVESHGTDVLLGSLPWGYSIIKLPWMETYISVEWN
ncbi:MAG: contractile injection system tape measure protein [Chitinophagaceae bacterium]